jgi:hypothetical protein
MWLVKLGRALDERGEETVAGMGAGECAEVVAANGCFEWILEDSGGMELIDERLDGQRVCRGHLSEDGFHDLFAFLRLKRAGGVEETASGREAGERCAEDAALA